VAGAPSAEQILSKKKQQYVEVGDFHDHRLRLVVQPFRLHWLLEAVIPAEDEVMKAASIGLFPNAIGHFVEGINRWFSLGTCPPLRRLAFGGVLFQPVEGRETGYGKLNDYLHSVTLDPNGSSDFLYQINRPRTGASGVEGIGVNRLTKWSVGAFEQVVLALGAPTVDVRATSKGKSFALRLEYDINTVHEFEGVLAKDKLPTILNGLVDLAKEIAVSGDIP
jgi:hypothetical protein